MKNNTVSIYPTHFLRGSELVERATGQYLAASENWPFPTQHRYGIPMDNYYAEVWANGMDWQNNYWVIEEMNLEDPQIQPLIIFEDSNQENRFKHLDFCMLIKAALYYRRDQVFVQHDDYGFYTDMVWPYLTLIDEEIRYEKLMRFTFRHASQPLVEFWMNPEFVPEEYLIPKGYEKPEINNVVEMPGVRPVS